MGVVYRATHLELGRPVALKLIAAQPRGRRRLPRALQARGAARRVAGPPERDPHLRRGRARRRADARHALRRRDRPRLARRPLRRAGAGASGRDRRPRSPRRSTPPTRRASCTATSSPPNVLLTGPQGEEHAYLTDFGLTKHSGSAEGVTRTGSFLGTPDFVAPEQIHGRPLDGRADVYSLGCVLYTIIALRPPFERESDIATLHAHLHDPPPRLTDAARGVPPGVRRRDRPSDGQGPRRPLSVGRRAGPRRTRRAGGRRRRGGRGAPGGRQHGT